MEIVEFKNNTELILASQNQQLDMVYVGPVLFACFQLTAPGTKAMNEIVSVLDHTAPVAIGRASCGTKQAEHHQSCRFER